MLKGIRFGIAAASVVAGITFSQTGVASAAHCVDPVTGASPGFSYFGSDHVAEEEAHGGSPEGGNPGPHAGTSGASNCQETTGNPAERAPGRNK